MTEVRALNSDAAKQQPESVFETRLKSFNEIMLTKGEKLATLNRRSILGRPMKEWQRAPTRASSSRS
jgi:hypothetical protein